MHDRPHPGTSAALSGRTVLITGGTGSFGRNLTSRLLAMDEPPRKVIIFSRDEFKQYEMAKQFDEDPRLRFFLGDVRDYSRLRRSFYGVNAVFHAAALKQVPAGEYNPSEVVKTNVIGAMNIIDAAIDCGVERVVALSSDKAANPINLYGATKLCSDKLFVAGNTHVADRATRFSVVRYGNVLASRGSVVPAFLAAREEGQLRITDRRMTRFWLTLDQAVNFVMNCAERMVGGEVFVPRIPSIQITDLAEALAPGVPIVETGIRPGEKMHEVMIPADEGRLSLELDGCYIIQPAFPWWTDRFSVGEEGRSPGERFEYRSDTNPHFLKGDEILELLQSAAVL